MAIIYMIMQKQHIYNIILSENNRPSMVYLLEIQHLNTVFFDVNIGDFTNIFSVAKNKAADINLFAYKIKFIAVA